MTDTECSCLFRFKGICARYLLRSASLTCLGSVCVAVAHRAGGLRAPILLAPWNSIRPGLDRLIFASWRALLGTSEGQGGINSLIALPPRKLSLSEIRVGERFVVSQAYEEGDVSLIFSLLTAQKGFLGVHQSQRPSTWPH